MTISPDKGVHPKRVEHRGLGVLLLDHNRRHHGRRHRSAWSRYSWACTSAASPPPTKPPPRCRRSVTQLTRNPCDTWPLGDRVRCCRHRGHDVPKPASTKPVGPGTSRWTATTPAMASTMGTFTKQQHTDLIRRTRRSRYRSTLCRSLPASIASRHPYKWINTVRTSTLRPFFRTIHETQFEIVVPLC